jgi:hypothetical protein
MRKLLSLLFFAIPLGASVITTASAGSTYFSPNTISHPGSVSFSRHGTQADAFISFGFASATTNANCGDLPVNSDCHAEAHAIFSDEITIFGVSGIIQAQGVFTAGRLSDAEGFVDLMVGGSGAHNFICSSPCAISSAFSSGVPFSIGAGAFAMADDLLPNDPNDGSSFATAQIRFSLLGVTNAAGEALTGFQYSSASGTPYVIPGGTFVPEPASIGLGFVGLALFFSLRLFAFCRKEGTRESCATLTKADPLP